MRIIEAIERRPFSLPIKDVLDINGDFSFLQTIRDKGYFNVEFQSSKLTLVAGNHVGQIPLTEEIAINVRPKIPINNLARIIALGNQPVKCLNFFKRTYRVEGDASKSLQEAIALSLVTSLKILDAEGLYREYLVKNENIPTLRGRINLPQFIRQKSSKANLVSLPCSYYELSADTLLNRLIKKAIFKIGNSLRSQTSNDRGLLSDLSYFANKLGNVKLDNSSNFISSVREHLIHKRIPLLREYYLDIIDTSLLILDGSGVEIVRSDGVSSMHSFIVNLENAFEFYIREILRQSPVFGSPEKIILDGNKEGKSSLFSDNLKFDAKPDIVIGPKENALAIGDVKYKTKLSETDRYQLIAHAISYNAKKAFFVTPLSEPGETQKSYIGKIGEVSLYLYKIDLEKTNLLDSELDFVNWVEALLF